ITLLGLMNFMSVPGIANAATSMTVSISCKDVTVNQTTTCTVTGKASGGSISGVEGKYSINGGASLSKYSVGSGWSGEGSGGSFSNYTDSNKSGSFTIGTFTIKGTKVGKVTFSLSNILAFDANFNEVKVSNSSRTFEVKEATTKPTTTKNPNTITQPSTQPTTSSTTTAPVPLELTSVRVDDFNVSYEGGVYYATVKPETDKVTISATAGNGITIIGTGQRNLAQGQNAVDLVLRNPGGQTATFQLIITRPEGMVISDTKLTSLKVVGYDFAFSPDTKEYTVTVPSSLNEVYVEAQSYSDDVDITGAGRQTLKKGTNEIYIRVSYGELGTTEYKITIKRSYMSVFMWIIIGTLGAGLVAMGIYANINRKAAVSKAVAEKNKVLAQNNRAELNSAPQVQLNGESVVGTGKKAVAPTPVKTVVATPATPASPVAQAPVAPSTPVAPVVQTVQPAKPTVVAASPATPNTAAKEPQMIQTAPPAQVKVVKTTVVPVQQPATQTVNTGATQGANVAPTNTNKPVV
ncbi:MAG: hypothetical protein K2L98_00855, partial [Bacilli bacterium]|nr:hypothetical protein [Bacilli bacterium]